MRASHPIWSGIAGFILVPSFTGFLGKLVVNDKTSIKAQAMVAGGLHAAVALGLYLNHSKFDGNMHSLVTGAIWGEAIDACLMPATILAADAFVQNVKQLQRPLGVPAVPPPPPGSPAQIAGVVTDAIAPRRGKAPMSSAEQMVAMLTALKAAA